MGLFFARLIENPKWIRNEIVVWLKQKKKPSDKRWPGTSAMIASDR